MKGALELGRDDVTVFFFPSFFSLSLFSVREGVELLLRCQRRASRRASPGMVDDDTKPTTSTRRKDAHNDEAFVLFFFWA